MNSVGAFIDVPFSCSVAFNSMDNLPRTGFIHALLKSLLQ